MTRARGIISQTWVLFNSQALEKGKWQPDYDLETGERLNTGTITIQYINLSIYEFPHRQLVEWMDLIESSSKGRFNKFVVQGAGKPQAGKSLWTPYRMVAPPTRTAQEIARIRKLRAPIGRQQQRRTYTVGGKRGAFGAGGRRT